MHGPTHCRLRHTSPADRNVGGTAQRRAGQSQLALHHRSGPQQAPQRPPIMAWLTKHQVAIAIPSHRVTMSAANLSSSATFGTRAARRPLPRREKATATGAVDGRRTGIPSGTPAEREMSLAQAFYCVDETNMDGGPKNPIEEFSPAQALSLKATASQTCPSCWRWPGSPAIQSGLGATS